MRVRRDILQADADMGTSGTLIYNLDYSDPITQILLAFDATNGATSNKNNPIERNITTIEIVDGGEVLWSLPGDVAYALYAQQKGGKLDDRYSGAISDGQWITIPIQFGRYPFDPLMAFNPNAFRNPQLKITFDEATVNDAGNTGFVSDSFTVTIGVDLVEDAPIPEGYLMSKELYSYTSLANGDTQIELPTDYPYRLLLLRVYESAQWWGTNIEQVKLNCDGGKFIPFDLSASELQHFVAERWPSCDREIYTQSNNAEYHQGWLGLGSVVGAHHHSGLNVVQASSYANGRFTFRIYSYGGAAVDTQACHAYIRGKLPHNTLLIPFGRVNDVPEFFDAPRFNSVKLYLTNGNANADVNVCAQQYRRY